MSHLPEDPNHHHPLHKHQGPVQTWRIDNGQGRQVLKEIALGKIKNWKQLELFEREIQVLKQLDHPQIPKLLEHYEIEKATGYHLCLIHEWIEGQALDDKLSTGWHPTLPEILNITIQVLNILVYLHNIKPLVLHRDIKPSNLVLSPEGSVHLIDFGAVQLALAPQGGSTVVGTFGYMAPELFSGQAQESSDLYALGMTIIHLLTQKEPQELLDDNLKLNWKAQLNLSLEWLEWLDQMVNPVLDLRFITASEALDKMPSLNQNWTKSSLLISEVDFEPLNKYLFNASYQHTLDTENGVVILKRKNSSKLAFGISLGLTTASFYALKPLIATFKLIKLMEIIPPSLISLATYLWVTGISISYLVLIAHTVFRLLALTHHKEFYFDGESLEIHERRTGNWKRTTAVPRHQIEVLSLRKHYLSWRIEAQRPNQLPYVIEDLFFQKEARSLHLLFSKILLPENHSELAPETRHEQQIK